ncbi:hypothetical protein AAG906_021406 [Vitis piasezkii]
MMEMLRRVPCFTDAEPPSTKMSDFFPLTKWILDCTIQETTEVVVVGVRNIVRQRALRFERLEIVEAIAISPPLEGATKGTEALKAAKWEKETICTEADKLREEGRTIEAKFKEAE